MRKVIFFAAVVACLTMLMAPTTTAALLSGGDLFFNPWDLPKAEYTQVELSGGTPYAWSYTNVQSVHVLPLLKPYAGNPSDPGAYPTSYVFTQNDYRYQANTYYSVDLTDGVATATFWGPGIYHVKLHLSDNTDVTQAMLVDTDFLPDDGTQPATGPEVEIPGPKADLVVVSHVPDTDPNAAKKNEALDDGANAAAADGQNVARAESIDEAVAAIQEAAIEAGRPIHVELVAHGSPGHFRIGTQGVGSQPGDMSMEDFQELLDGYVSGFSVYACSFAAGSEGDAALEILADSLDWASGWTKTVTVHYNWYNYGWDLDMGQGGFSKISAPPFTITASAGENGSIYPPGAVSVPSGGSQTFDFMANPGYVPDQVTIDGGPPEDAGPSYTFTDVRANHTIAVTFKASSLTYTITASAEEGGSIHPSGAVSVPINGNQTFTFTPNPGYIPWYLCTDELCVPAGASYTFTNVQADHTIDVMFTPSVNISGTVTDAVSHLPAGGVHLNVHVPDVLFDFPVTTGPDGKYSVDVVAFCLSYSIDAVVPQTPGVVMFTPLEDRSITCEEGLDHDVVWNLDIAYKVPVTGMSGVVRDFTTNLPIRNAVVQLGGKGGAAVVTDASGAYSFTGLSTYGDLYADAVGYTGKLMWVKGTGNLHYDIYLNPADELNSYNGDMEDLAPPFMPAQWTFVPWSGADASIDWSASADAKTGSKSLFYCYNATRYWQYNEHAGIYKIIQLAPGCDYNFWFSAKADHEVKRWQPMVEFHDAGDYGDNDGEFVSSDPAYCERSHMPPYDWHTYLLWGHQPAYGSGVHDSGPAVRITPPYYATQCDFEFLYEGDNANGPDRLPPAGKGCYIDDLVLDAVPRDLAYVIVEETRHVVGVNNRSVLTDDKLIDHTGQTEFYKVKVWGNIVSIGSGTYVISDGYTVGVTINGAPPVGKDVGDMVVVTGVVQADHSVTP